MSVRPAGRFVAAVVAAGLSAGGSVVPLNVTPLAAALVGLAVGCAAVLPVRVTRVAAHIVAALLGVLFALANALSYEPAYVVVVGALAAAGALCYAAWRDAVSTQGRWWDRATAAFASVGALFLLLRMVAQIGSEGGYCWLPGLPVGCIP